MGDETTKVFINADGTADDISKDMSEFLRYLREGIGNSSFVKKLDHAVKKARDHVEWRTEYMSLQLKFYDIWDEARDEGLEAGLEAGRIEGKLQQLFELVHDGLISIDDAVIRTELTKKEFTTQMNEYYSKK